MPRLKRVRKASDEGKPTTMWIRRGTIAISRKAALKQGYKSLSAFAEDALREKAERQSAA